MYEGEVGFTGTVRGISPQAKLSLKEILLDGDWIVLHHGDCIGADEQAHAIAKQLGYSIIVHPPTDPIKRAFVKGYREDRRLAPYMVRNEAIVKETSGLIAVVAGPEVSWPRSGEWATVRIARRLERQRWIIWPSGMVTRDNLDAEEGV